MQKLWQVQICSCWHQIKEWLETLLRCPHMKKMINTNCLRLVETVDFGVKIVLIRGRMQPVEAKQGQKQKLQGHFWPTELIDSVRPSWFGKLQKVTESWQCSLGGTKMNQSVRPSWSEKLPKIPVRVRLGFLMFWTEFLVLFLYGKSSRLINRWEVTAGWKTHNQQINILLFRVHLLFIYPLYLSSRSSLVLHAGGLWIHEALGASESTWSSP